MPDARELLRSLPSVSSLLENDEVRQWLTGLPRGLVVESLRTAVEAARDNIAHGRTDRPVEVEAILAHAEEEVLARSTPSLRAVINATGIVLHTGLGRAPLSDAAIEAIAEGASGYANLEYELTTGDRGTRTDHVRRLLTSLSGAESATVVNNNAAATLMILKTFAAGREVVVSRGQLVEIGGSFRLPEIMEASGAVLREVGTTNRTRLADYEKAVNDRTAMLLRVHPSNFRIIGFCEAVPIGPLAELAHRFGLIAVDDLGSGALVDMREMGLPDEPCVRDSIAAGVDLVCFSGDKLLGGPQCGIIAGRQELIQRLETDPLMRTYRMGKLTLLALEATLRCHQDPAMARAEVPALAMLSAGTNDLAPRAQRLMEQLERALPDERFFVCSDVSYAGGGSMPARQLQTVVVQWRPEHRSAVEAAAALRSADRPVVARVRDDAICFDLRTVRDREFEDLIESIQHAAWDRSCGDPCGNGADTDE